LAKPANSVDVVETALAGALEGVEIENFVDLALGSADGELGIVVVRGSAISAGAFDEVESI